MKSKRIVPVVYVPSAWIKNGWTRDITASTVEVGSL